MSFQVVDLGQMSYSQAYELQLKAVTQALKGGPDTLLFVEHPPVLTLGANFHEQNLLLTREEYARQGIEVVKTDRGGDVTFHGPGQQVVYPIFRLDEANQDLHRWLRNLEETMLRVLAGFGLDGRRFPPHTGAWVADEKVAAIGIKVRRWVSFHGIALNVENDLAPFSKIVPCGIAEYGVTSLSQLLGRQVTLAEVRPKIVRAFEEVFGVSSAWIQESEWRQSVGF